MIRTCPLGTTDKALLQAIDDSFQFCGVCAFQHASLRDSVLHLGLHTLVHGKPQKNPKTGTSTICSLLLGLSRDQLTSNLLGQLQLILGQPFYNAAAVPCGFLFFFEETQGTSLNLLWELELHKDSILSDFASALQRCYSERYIPKVVVSL